MATFKCKMCGGALEIQEGATTAECLYCGTRQTLPKLDDDRRRNLYDRANHFRQNGDFDKATAIFEQILGEDNTDAEAYWSLVLCRYGVEYVEDPATHKRVPTVNRTQPTPVASDEDYKSALRYADDYQTSIYEEEAKAIDEIQRGILAVSQKEQPFDVFICYKETDAAGQRTPDSVLAVDLHDQLAREGFKVFCARITLEDKLGTAYEPYIFAALNSAPVMVALGTKAEYFNAPWVRNEWSRYLSLIRGGARKTLIPTYRNMDPYDLPEEFAHLQAQDMSKLGFMQDLTRGIKKILGADKATVSPAGSAPVNSEVEPLLKRAFMFLNDGDFDKAGEYCERVLDKDPESARAYLGKLMVGLKFRSTDELMDFKTPIEDEKLFQRAMHFATGQDKDYLEGLAQANRAKIAQREAEEAARIERERIKKEQEAARIEQERMERAYKDIVTFKGSAESVNDIERLIRALEVLGSYKDA
ncbi:MAG: TIR domain-containing protein, partial [Synergistaceae bacterium]|nr:TIR domain-containing protein [Synergistaceae bacterium]